MRAIFAVLLLFARFTEAKTLVGLLMGKKEITLKAKSQGELVTINVPEGQLVKDKEVIAVIDDRRAKIEMDLAKAEYDLAKHDLESSKKLRRYLANDELKQKEAAYLKKKSIFENKSLDFDFTRILAPTSGVVTKKYFDEGETVSVGDKIFELVQMDELEVSFFLESRDIIKVSKQQELKFKVDAYKDQQFSGTVKFVSPVIDPASDTIQVTLFVKNQVKVNGSEFALKPGMLAKLEISEEQVGK